MRSLRGSKGGCVIAAVLLAACSSPSAARSPPDLEVPSAPVPPPAAPTKTATRAEDEDPATQSKLPKKLACLSRHFGGAPLETPEGWALELPGNVALSYDDGRDKSLDERLAEPDLEDQLHAHYVPGAIVPIDRQNGDPGRVRVSQLFAARYGSDEHSVRKQLVEVAFVGHRVMIHEKVAARLSAVGEKLARLVRHTPKLARYFDPLGGTFSYRRIAQTERYSPHSYGIAIDLNPALSAYFVWTPDQPWHGALPQEIVDAFESEGFIWGGRWFHYDTMHFEYRPELFDPDCADPVPDDASSSTSE
jgi:hypothetical protein